MLAALAAAVLMMHAAIAGAQPAADSSTLREAQEDASNGRTSFVVSTTLASVYAGVVLIDVLDVADFRPGVGLILGSTSAGFVGSYFGSRNRRISSAMSDAYGFGLGLGVGNSLLLASPLDLDTSEEVQAFALGGMALGGATGLIVSRIGDPTRAQVNLVSLSSTLGIATVGLGLVIVQPDGLEVDGTLLLLTAGLDAGALAGVVFGRGVEWSLARTRLIGLGTFLGGLVGWGTGALATGIEDVDDSTARLWSSATLAGTWGGFALAAYLTRGMTPDSRYASGADGLSLTPMPTSGGVGFAVSGSF